MDAVTYAGRAATDDRSMPQNRGNPEYDRLASGGLTGRRTDPRETNRTPKFGQRSEAQDVPMGEQDEPIEVMECTSANQETVEVVVHMRVYL